MIETEQQITENVWAAVRDLIDEVERDQSQEQLASSVAEWRLAVRQFRKVELKRLVLGEPTASDYSCHSICLHSLLAMGETLELWSRSFEPGSLALLRLSHDAIEAGVEDLKQSLREWQHGFTPQEVSSVREAVFGAAS